MWNFSLRIYNGSVKQSPCLIPDTLVFNKIFDTVGSKGLKGAGGGGGGGGGGGLHQNSLEIDFIVVSGRRE